MRQVRPEHLQLIQSLHRAGLKAGEIEIQLTQRGLQGDEAAAAVDAFFQAEMAKATPPPAPPMKWHVLIGGITLTVLAFIGMYLAFTHLPESVARGQGDDGRLVRHIITAVGGALAVAGIYAVQREITRWWKES